MLIDVALCLKMPEEGQTFYPGNIILPVTGGLYGRIISV
jgi:hypothetical protein